MVKEVKRQEGVNHLQGFQEMKGPNLRSRMSRSLPAAAGGSVSEEIQDVHAILTKQITMAN